VKDKDVTIGCLNIIQIGVRNEWRKTKQDEGDTKEKFPP
jgi:hypothetical protein